MKTPRLGKCWAAINDDRVVNYTLMYAPAHVDYDAHRNACVSALEAFGTVKGGELIWRDNQYIFVQRLTHRNRGKSPRTPKEYPVEQSVLRPKMDNVIQFQSRKQKTEKTRQEIYEEMAREGEALDNIQIIDVSPEESRLYQEAYEAEFQMQLDLITDRYNRLQKIKLVSDSDREPTA